MAKTFEDYIKSHPTFTADDARAMAQSAFEQQRIDEYEKLIQSDYFQEIIGKIKEAAANGDSSISILPQPIEVLESYTKEHKFIPEDMLSFTKEQREVIDGLKQLNYVANAARGEGYLDGMNPMDKPLTIEQATIYWGRN